MKKLLTAIVILATSLAWAGQKGDGSNPIEIRKNLQWKRLDERRQQLIAMIDGDELKNRVVNQIYRIPVDWIKNENGEREIYEQLLQKNLREKILAGKFQRVGQIPEGETEPIKQCAEVDGKPAPMGAIPLDPQSRVCFDVEALLGLYAGPVTNAELVGEVIHEYGHILLGLTGKKDDERLEGLATQISELGTNISLLKSDQPFAFWDPHNNFIVNSNFALEYYPSVSLKIGFKAIPNSNNNVICKLAKLKYSIQEERVEFREVYSLSIHGDNRFGGFHISTPDILERVLSNWKAIGIFPAKEYQSEPIHMHRLWIKMQLATSMPKDIVCRYKVGIYDHKERFISYLDDGVEIELDRGFGKNDEGSKRRTRKYLGLTIFENSLNARTLED